ncbi:MAG: formate dehydrogenase accessory protein FdhE [Candidatus Methylomirabilales bacterium]
MLRGTSWETIAQNLAAVRRIRSPLVPLADSLEPVLRLVHGEAQAAVPPEIRVEKPELRNSIGLPVFPRADFPIDVNTGVRLFRELAAVTASGPPATQTAISSLRDRTWDSEWVEGVLLAYTSGELEAAAAETDAASAQQLLFFARMALLPGLEAAGTSLSTWISPAWAEAACPVCGTHPRLAELRAPEGRRYLHCAFCNVAWQYAVTGCPACGSQEAERISILYVEEDRRSRLDVCEACRTYIKCVDNKEYFGIVPLVEDLLSPHLDVLAAEKGFRPIGN